MWKPLSFSDRSTCRRPHAASQSPTCRKTNVSKYLRNNTRLSPSTNPCASPSEDGNLQPNGVKFGQIYCACRTSQMIFNGFYGGAAFGHVFQASEQGGEMECFDLRRWVVVGGGGRHCRKQTRRNLLIGVPILIVCLEKSLYELQKIDIEYRRRAGKTKWGVIN